MPEQQEREEQDGGGDSTGGFVVWAYMPYTPDYEVKDIPSATFSVQSLGTWSHMSAGEI